MMNLPPIEEIFSHVDLEVVPRGEPPTRGVESWAEWEIVGGCSVHSSDSYDPDHDVMAVRFWIHGDTPHRARKAKTRVTDAIEVEHEICARHGETRHDGGMTITLDARLGDLAAHRARHEAKPA